MKIIDGKQLAQNLRGEIAAGVESLKSEKGVTPGLAVILVGDNPASVSYVTAKEKACAEAGMYSKEIRLPADIQNTLSEQAGTLIPPACANRIQIRLLRGNVIIAAKPVLRAKDIVL